MTAHLTLDPEVAAALADGRPVVALESTIITHGMPFPDNLETALRVQDTVRATGAVPATVAAMDGALRVGLAPEDLHRLAESPGVRKLSRADLAHALLCGDTGSTTVAATMIAAHLADIAVFATGGIGGVHRGAEASFDISADLEELARTPVTVVASGAKAILDLPKTLERLETLGVPVIAVGQDAFPAFWSAEAGHPAPLRLDTAPQIAAHHRLRRELGLGGGTLVANPVPRRHEIPHATIAPIVEDALAGLDPARVTAKDVTPHLLRAVHDMTGGASLRTNIELVAANARLAAQIAVAIAAAGD